MAVRNLWKMKYCFILLLVCGFSVGCLKDEGPAGDTPAPQAPTYLLSGTLKDGYVRSYFLHSQHAFYTNDTAKHLLAFYCNNGVDQLKFKAPYQGSVKDTTYL